MKKSTGFTLIELLVVIAIIGVLSTIIIVSFNGVRMKSRDARRVTDLVTVQTALEMYYKSNNFYPTYITAALPIANDDNSKTYLGRMPSNPLPRTDNNCPDSDYIYTVGANNNSYSLTVCVNGTSVSATNNGLFHCGDSITDRDNISYPTVQVNTQCWMAENLKTKTWPSGITLTMASNISERDCITTGNARGTESDCQAGRTLYATNVTSDICPSGWHIPSEDEVRTLELPLTDEGQNCEYNRGWRTYGGVCITNDPVGDACFNAGQKLKAGGSTGFNWQLTGVRKAGIWGNAYFEGAGVTGYLRTSTSAGCGTPGSWGSSGSGVRTVKSNSAGIQRDYLVNKTDLGDPGFHWPAAPIRCIKD